MSIMSFKVLYLIVFRMEGIACLRPVHVRKLAFLTLLLIILNESILLRFNKRSFMKGIPES